MTSSNKDLSQRALNVLIYFWKDLPCIEMELHYHGLPYFLLEINELWEKGYLQRREKSDRFRNKKVFVTPTQSTQAMLSLLPPLSNEDIQKLYFLQQKRKASENR